MISNAFYDVHCHALSLAHPSFLAFAQSLKRHGLEKIFTHITAPGYLVSALFFKSGERVRNMFSVMERDVCSIFELMEDDLAGAFTEAGDGAPLLRDGALRLGSLSFDRLVVCPLIMDFQGVKSTQQDNTYYDRPSAKPLAIQVRDMLEGIQDYRRARPGGFLEIRPFFGMDTRHYGIRDLSEALEAAFAGYAKGKPATRAAASRRAFAAMSEYRAEAPLPGRFAGIKVYPPLGFDPWPDGGEERDKVELLWSFCERRDIPVVTHCDDQGFRIVSMEHSWLFTSPERWEPVLAAHPKLRLDFAHFGAEYSHAIGKSVSTEWTDRIVRLMADHPNVYADISFDSADIRYYRWLHAYMARQDESLAALLEERLFFGTDFLLNLSKVRCYSDCYRLYAKTAFSDELKRRFGHDNPESFLFGRG
jgi:hypothetical protein